MMNDDSQANILGNRKTSHSNYPEKQVNYSPSVSYKYSQQGSGYNGASSPGRRRPDQFKRESPIPFDKLTKQNDIIIRLLKDIRDRLPPPESGDANLGETVNETIAVEDETQQNTETAH